MSPDFQGPCPVNLLHAESKGFPSSLVIKMQPCNYWDSLSLSSSSLKWSKIASFKEEGWKKYISQKS